MQEHTHAASSATSPATSTKLLPRLAYTLHETAEILGISYISVYRLVKRGILKSSRGLRCHLIPASEIERYLKTTMQTQPSLP